MRPRRAPAGDGHAGDRYAGDRHAGDRHTEAGLADRLRAATHSLHTRAEGSGVIADLLSGRASRFAYALLLRNLLPAYRCLEAGLERHRDAAGIGPVARPEVYRAAFLEADLAALHGPDWQRELPLLASGDRYARCVARAAAGRGDRLLGHAYARFLGDLNGGRVLERRLARSLGLAPTALSFYAYPDVGDLAAYRKRYRQALDDAAPHVDPAAVVDEGRCAFRLNIALSEEVQRRAAGGSAASPPA